MATQVVEIRIHSHHDPCFEFQSQQKQFAKFRILFQLHNFPGCERVRNTCSHFTCISIRSPRYFYPAFSAVSYLLNSKRSLGVFSDSFLRIIKNKVPCLIYVSWTRTILSEIFSPSNALSIWNEFGFFILYLTNVFSFLLQILSWQKRPVWKIIIKNGNPAPAIQCLLEESSDIYKIFFEDLFFRVFIWSCLVIVCT